MSVPNFDDARTQPAETCGTMELPVSDVQRLGRRGVPYFVFRRLGHVLHGVVDTALDVVDPWHALRSI